MFVQHLARMIAWCTKHAVWTTFHVNGVAQLANVDENFEEGATDKVHLLVHQIYDKMVHH